MSPNKRIIVHAGLPKTGTSSIQLFMERNHERLAQRGILFPYNTDYTLGNKGLGRGQGPHADVVNVLTDRAVKVRSNGIDWEAEISQFGASPHHTMIISAEAIAVSGTQLNHQAMARLSEVADVTLLFYLRLAVPWLDSLYSQIIFSGSTFRGKPIHLPALQHYVDSGYTGLLAPFEPYGALNVRNYDALTQNGSLMADFCRVIGADDLADEAAGAPRHNQKTVHRDEIMFLRALRYTQCSPKLFDILRNRLKDTPAAPERRSKAMTPAPTARKVMRKWNDEVPTLNNRFDLGVDIQEIDAAHWPANFLLDEDGAQDIRRRLGQFSPDVEKIIDETLSIAAT